MGTPNIFISYSHDSGEHKKWVHAFASDLMMNGVNVVLDQWDLRPGQDVVSFMHRNLAKAERVLMICSEKYVTKADLGKGGVGYEKLIVSAELAAKTDTEKFIPILRNNGSEQKMPVFLGSRLYLDFSSDELYADSLTECLHELHGIPLRPKPKLGAFAMHELLSTRQATPTESVDRPSLTPREIDTLRWTMEGKTTWEVGAILGISERTAALHLNNAMHKLQTTSKHQAVLKALRVGILK